MLVCGNVTKMSAYLYFTCLLMLFRVSLEPIPASWAKGHPGQEANPLRVMHSHAMSNLETLTHLTAGLWTVGGNSCKCGQRGRGDMLSPNLEARVPPYWATIPHLIVPKNTHFLNVSKARRLDPGNSLVPNNSKLPRAQRRHHTFREKV